MNIDRLKFAWARGARLQWETETGHWFTSPSINGTHMAERIHPDDAHLEYGPISSALREGVTNPLDGWEKDPAFVAAKTYVYATVPCEPIYGDHGIAHNWYLLFLAEYLADLGL